MINNQNADILNGGFLLFPFFGKVYNHLFIPGFQIGGMTKIKGTFDHNLLLINCVISFIMSSFSSASLCATNNARATKALSFSFNSPFTLNRCLFFSKNQINKK